MLSVAPRHSWGTHKARRGASLQTITTSIRRRHAPPARGWMSWRNVASSNAWLSFCSDVTDYAYELAVVEQAIGHCWPDVWDAQFSDWVSRDAARMHSLETPRSDCGICITIHRAASPIHAA